MFNTIKTYLLNARNFLARAGRAPKLKLFFNEDNIILDGWQTIPPRHQKTWIDEILAKTDTAKSIEAICFDGDCNSSSCQFFEDIELAYWTDDIIPPFLYIYYKNSLKNSNLIRAIENLNRQLGRKYDCRIFPN